MKLLNILLLLSTILLVVRGQRTLTFNSSTQALTCTTLLNPCFIDDPDVWNGVKPQAGDSFVIDFTSFNRADFVNASNVYLKTRDDFNSTILGSLNVTGVPFVVPNILFVDTNLTFTDVLLDTAKVVFDNEDSTQAGLDIEITNSWIVVNTSITGTSTIITSEGVVVDQLSSFVFQKKSSVVINGISTFHIQPVFTDSTTFATTDVIDGYLTLSQGINSDSLVIIGKATIGGSSNFETLIVNSAIDFTGAQVVIGGTLSFVDTSDNVGQFIMSEGTSITIAGTSPITVKNPVLNQRSQLIIQNNNCTVVGASGNGTVYFDINPLSNLQANTNYFTASDSVNIDVYLSGKLELVITNSFIGSIIEEYTPNNSDIKLVSFVGQNSAENIGTSNTMFTINDEASLALTSNKGSGIQGQNVNVLGTFDLAATAVTLTSGNNIVLMDQQAVLVLNSSNVYGGLNVIAGEVNTFGSSMIKESVTIGNEGIISFTTESGILNLNSELNMYGSLYIDDYLSTDGYCQLVVEGITSFVDSTTLMVNLLNKPNKGDRYNLMQSNAVAGTPFKNVVILNNGEIYNGNAYTVEFIDNNFVSLLFEPSVTVHHKLPGWGVFLIIVAILATVGGIFYVFYRYKKRSGYLPLN